MDRFKEITSFVGAEHFAAFGLPAAQASAPDSFVQ